MSNAAKSETSFAGRTAADRGWGSAAVRERLFILVTLAPAVILLAVYVFFPLAYSLYLSFFRTRLFNAVRFVGLENYQKVLADSVFWSALENTLLYTAASVILTLILGLAAALLLNGPIFGRDAFRTVMFVPYIIPYAAYALLWYWLFDPRYGLVNYLLSFVAIDPVPWLKSKDWVIEAFVLMSVWKRLGFTMVVFLAGLQTIPQELYDAATVDGAGRWQKFRHVTLPLLSPITLFIAIISLIYSLQLFVEPLVMTHGGPGDSSQSLGYLVYQQGFVYLNIGQGSVTAIVLCVLTFVLSLLLLRRFDTREVYR